MSSHVKHCRTTTCDDGKPQITIHVDKSEDLWYNSGKRALTDHRSASVPASPRGLVVLHKSWDDPIHLAWMVKEVEQLARKNNQNPDPIQLAWMVNQVVQLRHFRQIAGQPSSPTGQARGGRVFFACLF